MDVIEPLSGWLLSRIVQMDAASPKSGFAGFMLRASIERRQVVAAFLAATEPTNHANEEVVYILMEGRHSAILRLAYGYVTAGFRSALARCGAQTHERAFYPRLWELLNSGSQHIVIAIQRAPELDPDRLSIITSLPVDLCDSRINTKINDKAQAADIVLAVDLLERRGLDRADIIEALRRSTKLTDTIKRWSLRMPFPAGPIRACDGYRPITNGLDLAATARRYRNCSRRYFTSLLSAEHAFGEFRHDEQEVLISYDRSQGYWLVEGVYGYRNENLPASVSDAAYAFAARNGVMTRRMTDRSDNAMQALRRLSRYYADWDV
jgi:hypothetical protein